MEKFGVPASVKNNAVTASDLQLQLLHTIRAYRKKYKISYNFSVQVGKMSMTMDVDLEENHYTVAGGKGARRRRKERRKESVIEPTPRVVDPTPRVVNQRNTPATEIPKSVVKTGTEAKPVVKTGTEAKSVIRNEAIAPRDIQQNARLHPKPPMKLPLKLPMKLPPVTAEQSSRPALQVRIEELVDKQNSKINLDDILRPLPNKMMHKNETEKTYMRKIFCWFCTQYQEPVHFCHLTKEWRHVDTFHNLEIIGNTRISVERTPGYDAEKCEIISHKNNKMMFNDQLERSEREKAKREREKAHKQHETGPNDIAIENSVCN